MRPFLAILALAFTAWLGYHATKAIAPEPIKRRLPDMETMRLVNGLVRNMEVK